MYQLTIEQSFDAAHFLADYHGECSNIHGHRWRVLLEVESEALQEDRQERGMCVDFSVIKKELKEIVDTYDHNFLIEKGSMKDNTMAVLREEGFSIIELPFRPTAENFARFFYDRLLERGHRVSMVKVYETPNNCAAYRA